MSQLLCLMFHSIDKNMLTHRYSISEPVFDEFLAVIKKKNYQSIDTKDLNGNLDKMAIHLSFDDGASSDLEMASVVLLKHKLKATFFVTTSYIGTPGYMNWEQVQELKQRGFDIQSHSHGHKLLATLSKNEIEADLKLAKDTIEKKLGSPVEALSLPGGSLNKEVLAAAFNTGHKYIFTSIPKINSSIQENVFHRILVKHNTTLGDLEQILLMDRHYLKKEQAKYNLRKAVKSVLSPKVYYFFWKRFYKNRVGK